MYKYRWVALLITVILGISCGGEKQQHRESSATPGPDYIAAGQNIVSQAQAVLAKNLIDAINSGGPEHALEFCNIQAYPLTDSMSIALNAQIRRVTDKPRNPANRASDTEMVYLRLFGTQLAQDEQPEPAIIEEQNIATGYYPIITNALCLQCHGRPNDDITPATLTKIHALYPEDAATGYDVNMLRGMWVVRMGTQQK